MLSIINNKSIFKICYTLMIAINFLPIINIKFFSRILLALFAFWGVYLFFKDLCTEKKAFFKDIKRISIFILFISFALAYFINIRNNGIYKIIALGYYFLSAYFLFENKNNRFNEKEFMVIANGYIIICFITAVISNLMYLFQTHIAIKNRAGHIVHVGVFENRLFGLFSSPNVGSTFILLGIFISFVVMWLKKDSLTLRWKIFYYIFHFFGLIYYSLSLSRGAYVCLTASIIVFFLLTKLPNFLSQKSNFVKLAIIRIGAIVISIVILSSFVKLTRFFMVESANFVCYSLKKENFVDDNTNMEEEFDKITLERIEGGSGDISNKRFAIWEASLNCMKGKYIFGIGDTVFNLEKVKEQLSKKDVVMIKYSAGNIHNGYLQIFVECGGISFIIYLTILVWFVIKALKNLYNLRNNSHKYQLILFILAISFYILLNNCFESNMALKGANAFQAILWLFAGYTVTLFDSDIKSVE